MEEVRVEIMQPSTKANRKVDSKANRKAIFYILYVDSGVIMRLQQSNPESGGKKKLLSFIDVSRGIYPSLETFVH